MDTFIFDFDGVIINSRQVQINALQTSYEQFVGGAHAPIEEFFKHSGGRLEDIFQTLELPKEMVQAYIKYSIDHMNEIEICKSMDLVLGYLLNNGFKIGLCTGKEKKRTLQILEHLNLRKYFQFVVCSNEVINPKPDKESLERCLKGLETSADKAFMVGDAVNDILCAKHAGVKSIAVTWGEGKYSDLYALNPDYLFSNVNELLDLIIKLNKSRSDVDENCYN